MWDNSRIWNIRDPLNSIHLGSLGRDLLGTSHVGLPYVFFGPPTWEPIIYAPVFRCSPTLRAVPRPRHLQLKPVQSKPTNQNPDLKQTLSKPTNHNPTLQNVVLFATRYIIFEQTILIFDSYSRKNCFKRSWRIIFGLNSKFIQQKEIKLCIQLKILTKRMNTCAKNSKIGEKFFNFVQKIWNLHGFQSNL